ncbi:MAG: XRE family transcriptional regulator [Deltaproteobacteria bacterium]|nr:XRE family transcriptional regulator [Deltaproteobacteria bacterium]
MKTQKYNKKLTPYQIKLIKNMKYFREAKGLTQRDLAEGMGASQAYYSQIESFSHVPSNKFVERFMKYIGVGEEEFYNSLDSITAQANLRRIEVLSVPGGRQTDTLFINTGELVDKMGRVYVGMDLYALKAKDDAMFPAVKNGDFMVVKEYKTGATMIEPSGRVVIARKKNEQSKIVVRRYDKEENILKADNPEFADLKAKDWEIIGIVILAVGVRKL